jgi:putative hydrolase of the HAD superfamily
MRVSCSKLPPSAQKGDRSRLVVFDGDDTLWKTQETYDTIKQNFARLLGEHGIQTRNAVEVLDGIDAARVPTEGFTTKRFVDSMHLTYEQLAQSESRPASHMVHGLIDALSEPLFYPPELYGDTLATLAQLRPYYWLALLTEGETNLQKKKVADLRLTAYLDRVEICPRKAAHEYQTLLVELGVKAKDAWAVGNSVRSDINPAVAVGLRAILIPRGTWRYEEQDSHVSDHVVVGSLAEAARFVLYKDGLANFAMA